MSDSHKQLCQQNKGYADIWDKKFGVVNNSIVPDSVKDLADTSHSSKVKTKGGPARTPKKARRSGPRPQSPPKARGLGDLVESSLTNVGITSERVERWLGVPCGCAERKQKLNQLGQWAKQIAIGKTEDAKEHLEKITGQKL